MSLSTSEIERLVQQYEDTQAAAKEQERRQTEELKEAYRAKIPQIIRTMLGAVWDDVHIAEVSVWLDGRVERARVVIETPYGPLKIELHSDTPIAEVRCAGVCNAYAQISQDSNNQAILARLFAQMKAAKEDRDRKERSYQAEAERRARERQEEVLAKQQRDAEFEAEYRSAYGNYVAVLTRNRQRLRELQSQFDTPFHGYYLTYGVVAEDSIERTVETRAVPSFSEHPDEKEYWQVVVSGTVHRIRYTHIVSVEDLGHVTIHEHTGFGSRSRIASAHDYLWVPANRADEITTAVAAAGFEPLPILPPDIDEFDDRWEIVQKVRSEVDAAAEPVETSSSH